MCNCLSWYVKLSSENTERWYSLTICLSLNKLLVKWVLCAICRAPVRESVVPASPASTAGGWHAPAAHRRTHISGSEQNVAGAPYCAVRAPGVPSFGVPSTFQLVTAAQLWHLKCEEKNRFRNGCTASGAGQHHDTPNRWTQIPGSSSRCFQFRTSSFSPGEVTSHERVAGRSTCRRLPGTAKTQDSRPSWQPAEGAPPEPVQGTSGHRGTRLVPQ